MTKIKNLLLMAILSIYVFGVPGLAAEEGAKEMQENKIKVVVDGGETFTAILADNSSARALVELLKNGDITIDMEDYANMEKVGPLGKKLPRNDAPTTTSCGDLILYQGKYFVIYYARNSWSLTRLGRIEGASSDQIISALGEGGVRVRLSIAD